MKNIFMACYGAGHVNALLPIAKKLNKDNNINLKVLGFTTAKKVFYENGIPVIELGNVIKNKDDKIVDYVKDIIKTNQHPDIKFEDSLNYNFIGLKPGDKWCLCANRWKQAEKANCAPPVILESTHSQLRDL